MRLARAIAVTASGVLLLLTACSRPAPARPAFEFDGDEVRVPVRFASGVPVVEVRVNGKGPYRFVLDSGCGTILVSRKVIKEAALPAATNRVKAFNSAGRSYSAETYRMELIELGDARLRRIGAMQAFDWFDPSQDIQGILGFAHFAGCHLSLDFPRQLLTLEKPKPGHKHTEPAWPMEMDQGSPYVTLRVGAEPHRFQIDTGSNGGLTIRESAVTNLPCCPERYTAMVGVAGGKAYLNYRTRLTDDLQIGPHTLVQPYVSWTSGVPGVGSMVGTEILRHFALEFDFAEGRVRFLRDTTELIQIPNRRQLGFMFKRDTNAVMTIQRLLPPFTAEMLGVKLDDEVVMLDGKPATELNEEAIAAMVQKSQLPIIVRRNGVLVTNTVPVQEDRFTFGKSDKATPTGKK